MLWKSSDCMKHYPRDFRHAYSELSSLELENESNDSILPHEETDSSSKLGLPDIFNPSSTIADSSWSWHISGAAKLLWLIATIPVVEHDDVWKWCCWTSHTR